MLKTIVVILNAVIGIKAPNTVISKNKLSCFLLSIFISSSIAASDLEVRLIEWSEGGNPYHYKVKLMVYWNNSWRNQKNYDAAWLFLKYTTPAYHRDNYRHAKLSAAGHRVLVNHIEGSPLPTLELPSDRVGLFIYPSSRYRGPVRWTIELSLDTAILNIQDFDASSRLMNAYGIEMVQIPQSPFTLGESDTAAAWRNAAFFLSDGNGRPGGLKKITSEEDPIIIGKQKGHLYYNSGFPKWQGDQKGIVPGSFPKGFNSFYMMKYETTQGQYVDFLNCISNYATIARTNFNSADYYTYRGSIRFEKEKYIAGSPNRPCNYLSWDDACAYADWACLRPMTELEYEKACRGSQQPIANEYPWNTNSKDQLMRWVNKQDELIWLNDLKEINLDDNNRDQYGASYYWVMDLAGSLFERVITIGDSTGRAFKGTHGDGNLTSGFASNTDWPKGSTETWGFGFRGGGHHEFGMKYNDINPHTRLAHRNFGAWSLGQRTLDYGCRLARTANPSTIIQ